MKKIVGVVLVSVLFVGVAPAPAAAQSASEAVEIKRLELVVEVLRLQLSLLASGAISEVQIDPGLLEGLELDGRPGDDSLDSRVGRIDFDAIKPEATYGVAAGEVLLFSSGSNRVLYRDLWDRFAEIAPDNYTNSYLRVFEIFEDEDSDVAAYVTQNEDGQWLLGVNAIPELTDDPREMDHTFVHEFAHILSLNSGEVRGFSGNCRTYEVDEGCADTDSFLFQFVDQFWHEDDIDFTHELFESDDDRDDIEDLLQDFYLDNAEDFVSPYAATHPVEDFAESFTDFVLFDKADRASGLMDDKNRFFYDFDELVEMRDEIRDVL